MRESTAGIGSESPADDAAPARRLLVVHAHPDDETINTGALMAKYAAAGDQVTLVTCTLGEEGEILVPEVAHLASDRDGGLGPYRLGELERAMRALGIRDVRILGGVGRFADSGMIGTPANENSGCFWRAPLDEAVGELVSVIVDVRPQVVITYDANGGYGHPDHIQAHNVTHSAVDAAAKLGWNVQKVYACARSRSVEIEDRGRLEALGVSAPFQAGTDDMQWAVEDSQITTAIDGTEYAQAKREAMRAHATQISVSADGNWYALSDGIGASLSAIEYLTIVRGEIAGERDSQGYEIDVFAGVR